MRHWFPTEKTFQYCSYSSDKITQVDHGHQKITVSVCSYYDSNYVLNIDAMFLYWDAMHSE